MKDTIEKFCKYYNACIGPSDRVYRRPKISKIPWDPTFTDFNSHSTFEYETVPMVQIEMPEDRFRHFVEFREKWHSILADSEYPGEMHTKIWKEFERESRLRSQHAGLQDLWERYQAMLAMVDDGQ